MTQKLKLDLADYVSELTRTHTHIERLPGRKVTVVRRLQVPALITQLWQNDVPSATLVDGPRPGFGSKPAARLDALDTAARIDIEAEDWIKDLGHTPRSSDTIVMINQLHGLTPVHRYRDVENDVRRWWMWARIVTGWDSPAWQPDATCPQCGKRGTIRIRLTDQHATCVNDACRVTWDQTTIGVLATHIRLESEDRRISAVAGPCWCPWPMPDIPDLSRMCPRCGTARCHRALAMRILDTLRIQQGA